MVIAIYDTSDNQQVERFGHKTLVLLFVISGIMSIFET